VTSRPRTRLLTGTLAAALAGVPVVHSDITSKGSW